MGCYNALREWGKMAFSRKVENQTSTNIEFSNVVVVVVVVVVVSNGCSADGYGGSSVKLDVNAPNSSGGDGGDG